MSHINLHYPMPCNLAQSEVIIAQLLQDLSDKYHISHERQGNNQYKISGSGINGEVNLDHDELIITAKLNFMMLAFKSTIEKEILSQLDKSFENTV